MTSREIKKTMHGLGKTKLKNPVVSMLIDQEDLIKTLLWLKKREPEKKKP